MSCIHSQKKELGLPDPTVVVMVIAMISLMCLFIMLCKVNIAAVKLAYDKTRQLPFRLNVK